MNRKSSPQHATSETTATLSLEARFAAASPQLNDSRRQLLRAILDSPEEHFFLSSRKLAKRYRVDASTVVRAIQALGYERFDDFAADLRKHFVTRITPYAVLKSATREKRSLSDHIRLGVERDADNLHRFLASLNEARIIELAKQIHRARRIVVIGVDLAASLAWFLAYGLQPLGLPSEAPVGSAGNLLHKVRSLTDKDLLIAISFGRCLRDTVEAAQRARRRGVPTFAITDSEATPLAQACDRHLLAATTSPSFTGSYVAPMALLNAILVACAHHHSQRSLAYLEETEEEYRSGARWYKEPPPRKPAAAKAGSKSTARRQAGRGKHHE